jgi:phage-related protein
MNVAKIGLLVFSLGLGTSAMAAKDPNPDITRQELQNFDNFLDTHPAIDSELTKDPKLIDSSEYIAAHPELKTFLSNHPGVREEMKETPRFFMHREEQFDKSDRDITHREAANLDVFLDTHPGVEQDLRKNPDLVKNPEFISKHPEFAEFLGNHPAVKADLAENPKAFMRREAEFERAEQKEEAREAKKEERQEEKQAAKAAKTPAPKAAAAARASR